MKELVSKQDEELNNYVFKYLEVIDKIYLAECHLMFLQRV